MKSSHQLIKHPTAQGFIFDLKMSSLCSIVPLFEDLRPADVAELILSYNALHSFEEPFLLMRGLIVLNVAVNQIKQISGLENCKKLESLNISTNRVSNMAGLSAIPSLIRLDLSLNYISKIEGLEPLSRLRLLNLSHNNLRKLENLETLVNLECLDVSKNKLSDLGCLETTRLPRLKRLLSSYNQLSETYFQSLLTLMANFQGLEELDLIGNGVAGVKEFMVQVPAHAAEGLKILNGGPVFQRNTFFLSKNIEKKPVLEIKMPKFGSMDNLAIPNRQIVSSMKDLINREPSWKKQNSDEFMTMVSNHSMLKTSERFKSNQEYLSKLKQSYSGTDSMQPIIKASASTSPIKKSPSNMIAGNSPTGTASKRPSTFSIKNMEEQQQSKKTHEIIEEQPNQEDKPQKSYIGLIKLETSPKDPKGGAKRRSSVNEPQLIIRQQQKLTSILIESNPDIGKHSVGSLEDNIHSIPSQVNSKDSSTKKETSLLLQETLSRRSKEHSGHFSESGNRNPRNLSIETGSQKDVLIRKGRNKSKENSQKQIIPSEINEKLKERFEKFKEKSRRNSDIVKINKKNIDWKEKRAEFLLKKQVKLEEEEDLARSLKRGPLNQEEKKKGNQSQMCRIF